MKPELSLHSSVSHLEGRLILQRQVNNLFKRLSETGKMTYIQVINTDFYDRLDYVFDFDGYYLLFSSRLEMLSRDGFQNRKKISDFEIGLHIRPEDLIGPNILSPWVYTNVLGDCISENHPLNRVTWKPNEPHLSNYTSPGYYLPSPDKIKISGKRSDCFSN